ncbi:MAG: PilN domain-containing protein [Methylococcales bacterium]
MAKINLLPWREELRKKKKQDFIGAIGLSALVAIGILAGVHVYIEQLIGHQEYRNKILSDEIAFFDQKISKIKTIEEKKAKLLNKIDVIQKLQESRPEIVHLFVEIPKATPDGVFLTKFSQIGSQLTFDGKSQSNARVSAFMRAIESSPWLNNPRLGVIQSPNKTSFDQLSDFSMLAKLGKKKSESANGGGREPVRN